MAGGLSECREEMFSLAKSENASRRNWVIFERGVGTCQSREGARAFQAKNNKWISALSGHGLHGFTWLPGLSAWPCRLTVVNNVVSITLITAACLCSYLRTGCTASDKGLVCIPAILSIIPGLIYVCSFSALTLAGWRCFLLSVPIVPVRLGLQHNKLTDTHN